MITDTDETLMFAGEVRRRLAQNNFYDAIVTDQLAEYIHNTDYEYDLYNGTLKMNFNKTLPNNSLDIYKNIDLALVSIFVRYSSRLMQILGRENMDRLFTLPARLFYTIMRINDKCIILQF